MANASIKNKCAANREAEPLEKIAIFIGVAVDDTNSFFELVESYPLNLGYRKFTYSNPQNLKDEVSNQEAIHFIETLSEEPRTKANLFDQYKDYFIFPKFIFDNHTKLVGHLFILYAKSFSNQETIQSIAEVLTQKIRAEIIRTKTDKKIHDYQVQLESLVQTRTDELFHKNIELEKEIEQRKKTEAELREAKLQAESSTRIKSSFLANMSHEIRTPLNGIIGITEVLKKTELNETQKRYVDIIARSGDTLLALINDILDLSRLESGQILLEEERFNLRQIIREVLESLEAKFVEKDLHFYCRYPLNYPSFFIGDHVRLKQIFTNLISNACKFTHHGHVGIIIEINALLEDKYALTVIIEDTGIGIPTELQEKVFDRFWQAKTYHENASHGGTGLGLAICKSIAGLLGGTLKLESDVGIGTKVALKVPIQMDGGNVYEFDNYEYEEKDYKFIFAHTYLPTALSVQNTLETAGFRCEIFDCNILTAPKIFREELLKLKSKAVLIFDVRLLSEALKKAVDDIASDKTILVPIMSITHPIELDENFFTHPNIITLYQPIFWKWFFDRLIDRNFLKFKLDVISSEVIAANLHAIHLASRPLNKKVLIAEDNYLNQIVIVELLKILNYECTIVNDGVEAVKQFNSNPYFDLVILDCQMPKLDGFGALQQMRTMSKKGKNIPIIALTANAMSGEKEKCLKFGFSAYIPKPVTLESLTRTLEQL